MAIIPVRVESFPALRYRQIKITAAGFPYIKKISAAFSGFYALAVYAFLPSLIILVVTVLLVLHLCKFI